MGPENEAGTRQQWAERRQKGKNIDLPISFLQKIYFLDPVTPTVRITGSRLKRERERQGREETSRVAVPSTTREAGSMERERK